MPQPLRVYLAPIVWCWSSILKFRVCNQHEGRRKQFRRPFIMRGELASGLSQHLREVMSNDVAFFI